MRERRRGEVNPRSSWTSTLGGFGVRSQAQANAKHHFPASSRCCSLSDTDSIRNLSNGAGEWNHYYVRCINGEIRLWVNGEEVSGGNHIEPASGYLCLESEGAPVDFREVRVRELP